MKITFVQLLGVYGIGLVSISVLVGLIGIFKNNIHIQYAAIVLLGSAMFILGLMLGLM